MKGEFARVLRLFGAALQRVARQRDLAQRKAAKLERTLKRLQHASRADASGTRRLKVELQQESHRLRLSRARVDELEKVLDEARAKRSTGVHG
jgi:hypothetical protein